MSNLPGARPAPDFSDPLGLLAACHGRILNFCSLIERLVDAVENEGSSQPVCDAANRVVQYFSTAGRHHHADEEEDVFPLLAQASPDLAIIIDRLKEDHFELERAWLDLENHLLGIVDLENPGQLKAAAERFCTLSRNHVKLENQSILPHAARLLDDAQLKGIGHSMARRRGVTL